MLGHTRRLRVQIRNGLNTMWWGTSFEAACCSLYICFWIGWPTSPSSRDGLVRWIGWHWIVMNSERFGIVRSLMFEIICAWISRQNMMCLPLLISMFPSFAFQSGPRSPEAHASDLGNVLLILCQDKMAKPCQTTWTSLKWWVFGCVLWGWRWSYSFP